jgi:hypothetical protein
MILKGCWFAIVAAFFWVLASAIFGPWAGWLVLAGAVVLISLAAYQAFSVPKVEAQALAQLQQRVALKITDALPLDLAEEAKSAPRLAPEGAIEGFNIDTDGFSVLPASEEPFEFTLICQAAAQAGADTVLVAHGQLLIGRVKSEHLKELYAAVMSAGGLARCVGTVSGLDVAKPFGLIKGT